jgi:hypothetical protein
MRCLMIVCALACSLVAACGGGAGDDSDAAAAPAGLVIPAGAYRVAKFIAAGQETPAATEATVVVSMLDTGKTQFVLTGEVTKGNTCKPRAWVAKIDAAGDASAVERTQENCTESAPRAEWEARKRNYRLSGTSFVERISDGETQIEVYYDRK